MPKKEILLDNIHVGYGTKVEINDELSTESTPTFDGTIVDSDPNPSVTVSIDAVRAGTINDYINLEKKLKYAEQNPVTVQVIEEFNGIDGLVTVKEFAYNAKLSSNKTSFDVKTRTALNVELKAEAHKKFINGVEIKA